jgi:hypothetical protein
MVQYVITPWRSQSDLLTARSAFYPHGPPNTTTPAAPLSASQIAAQHRAVSLISIWVQRGNCPHLIESTALLTAAQLLDSPPPSSYQASQHQNSAYAVRASYSAAFCRFVTGLLDGYQDKKHKQSMYSIARNIGLPASFVELRHQCTHEELPNLGRLRGAVKKSLSWIWEAYWSSLGGVEAGTAEEEERGSKKREKAEPKRDSAKGPERLKAALLSYMDHQAETVDHPSPDELELERPHEAEGTITDYSIEEILEVLQSLRSESSAGGDTSLMLRCLQLTRAILDGTADEDVFGDYEVRGREEDDGEDEAENEGDHGDGGEEEAEGENEDAGPRNDGGDDGWARWEGPWVPKPIGCI